MSGPHTPRVLAVLALAAAAAPLCAQGLVPSGSRLTEPPDARLVPPNALPEHLKFGPAHWQDLTLYRGAGSGPHPVIVAFNGIGGWARHRLTEAGISLALIVDGRSNPTAPETIDGVVEALRFIDREAGTLGIDREQVVLLGVGNGGSLATLFGTDPALFERAGIPFANLRAVISIGGEDFDVLRRAGENAYLRSLYRRHYSRDEAELARLSPMTHLAPPNAPAFLLMAEARDENGIRESQRMAAALASAGAAASYAELPDPRERVRATQFMAEEAGSGREVMPFLRSVLTVPDVPAR